MSSLPQQQNRVLIVNRVRYIHEAEYAILFGCGNEIKLFIKYTADHKHFVGFLSEYRLFFPPLIAKRRGAHINKSTLVNHGNQVGTSWQFSAR